MIEMIREREKLEKIERHDLFSSLLAANSDIDSAALSDSELTGTWAFEVRLKEISALARSHRQYFCVPSCWT